MGLERRKGVGVLVFVRVIERQANDSGARSMRRACRHELERNDSGENQQAAQKATKRKPLTGKHALRSRRLKATAARAGVASSVTRRPLLLGLCASLLLPGRRTRDADPVAPQGAA